MLVASNERNASAVPPSIVASCVSCRVVEPDAAVFWWNSKTKQAELAHFGDDFLGHLVLDLQTHFVWYETLDDEAFNCIRQLIECLFID